MNWQAREAERWLTQALRDLEAAQKLLHQKEYNWVCFIAQQAAEKAVKAVHLARGESVERIHSIFALIKGDQRAGVSAISQLSTLVEQARSLDKTYIPTRYPNGVPFGIPADFYSRENGEECIACAKEIIEAVRGILTST
ncbi:MAG: HEPN domain-containing protein [Chloroflexi bacterium]|nr:HEPN domain-containing protein [Chloroflexota bacterium]